MKDPCWPKMVAVTLAKEKEAEECKKEARTPSLDSTVSVVGVADLAEAKATIWRNVGLLTLGAHLNYSAYYGICSLQLVLNSDQPLYKLAYQTTLVFYAVASYFFPTVCVARMGLKRTVVLTFGLFMSYVLANYFPSAWTLLPTAVLRGVGGGIFWNIKGTCLATFGNSYSAMISESNEFTIPRFFGVFFGGYQAAFVTAIMVSSFLMHKPEAIENQDSLIIQEDCIARYCYEDIRQFFPHLNVSTTSDLSHYKYVPDDYHTYLLYGVFTALVVFAVIVVIFMTADKHLPATDSAGLGQNPFRLVAASVKHLFQPFDLLLLPSYLYIGVVDAFSGGELTMGLIPCTAGLDNVGFAFTMFGLFSAVFGVLGGYAVKYVGRQAVTIFGFVCHAAVIFAMQHGHLDYNVQGHVVLIAAGWGIAAVILDVQISAFIGCVFPTDSAPVLANFILFQILGNSLWRLFGSYMCLHVQLYFVLVLLMASLVGYVVIEVVLRLNSDMYKISSYRKNSKPCNQIEIIRY